MSVAKKKFSIRPTLFVVTIAGQDFQFAALSQKDMERFVIEEKAAEGNQVNIKAVWREIVATSLTKGGTEVAADDLEEMDTPLFSALFTAVMQAQGMKLEAKLGEVKPL